ncbi:terpene synthase family protein [Actinomadura sp. 21ATH]|uniref:terpene synthase family protein n=1 Tax=Actinomadura sp. 21ATH TaxID=1735444 RepID=UPI0035BEF634
MGPVVDASLLLSLTDRAASLAAPSVMRADAWKLGERVGAWARGRGLVLGDPDTSPLGRARCERLAARLFPAAEPARVDLFARWLTWTFALDDTLDETSVAGSATNVHAVFEDLTRALRRGHASPGARPLETTVVELWQATGRLMSREWRRRFLAHLDEHRAGCADQAVHRRTRRLPAPGEYAALRRRGAAPYLYDLIEAVLGVELPERLLGLPAFQDLLQGTADVLNWSNDVASYGRESVLGDAHNLVIVLSATYGVDAARAGGRVADLIAARSDGVLAGARAMVGVIDKLRLTPAECAAARQVVRVLLGAPRAHIDWLAESGRYTSGSNGHRLDALASLR